jgi:hypothetical protein
VVDPDGLEYPIRELAMLPNPEIVRWFKGQPGLFMRAADQASESAPKRASVVLSRTRFRSDPPSTVFLRVET